MTKCVMDPVCVMDRSSGGQVTEASDEEVLGFHSRNEELNYSNFSLNISNVLFKLIFM